mgnify:CR=1 FL=1
MDAYVENLENGNEIRLQMQQAQIDAIRSAVLDGSMSVDEATSMLASRMESDFQATTARSLTIEDRPPIAAAPLPTPPNRQ